MIKAVLTCRVRLIRCFLPCLLSTTLLIAVVRPSIAEASTVAESDVSGAEKLWKEGKIHFETADYEDAVDKWKQAYALLPDAEESRAMRHALAYNISEAQAKAYEVNRNPMHLRKAKVLLEDYLEQHRSLYGDVPEALAERTKVGERLREVEAMIQQSEARGETAALGSNRSHDTQTIETASVLVSTAPAPPANNLTPRQQRAKEIKQNPQLKSEYSKARSRIVVGSILTGIGTLFGIVAASALISYMRMKNGSLETVNAETGDVIDESPLMGATAAATGFIALGMMIPGGMLLGRGIKSRRKLRPPQTNATLGPWFSTRGGGLVGQVRF